MKLWLAVLLVGLAACTEIDPMPAPALVAPQITEDQIVMPDGAALPMTVWRADPPRAVMLALHGFNDYRLAFELPGPVLARAGIAVYAYDQRGFGAAPRPGRWPGQSQLRADLHSALDLVASRHPGVPLYLLGESMGGAVAITTLTDGLATPPLAGLILVAPAVWSRAEMPWYQSAALWVTAHTIPWVTLTGRGLKIQASDNIEMLRRMSRDPLVIKETRIESIQGLCDLMDAASLAAARLTLPTLVLSGRQDQVVPPDATQAMLANRPSTMETRFYPEGYHMLLRDLHRDRPLDDLIAWTEPRAADR